MKHNVRNGAISRMILLMALLGLLMTALTSPVTPSVHAESTDPLTASIEQAVVEAITKLKGRRPEHGAFVNVMRLSDDNTWAFGTVVLLAPKNSNSHDTAKGHSHHEMPEGRLWLAQRTANGWEAAIDYTPTFRSWLQKSPAPVTSNKEKQILGSAGPEQSSTSETTYSIDASSLPPNKLSLPWTPGQRWEFSSGPHVHFNIRYNGQHINWHGQKIGGWTIYEGSQPYEGCAQRGAEVICASGLMTNYDTSQRTYDGADKAVVYEGSWRHETNTDDTAWNTLSSSTTAGSKARFSFTGRRISLIYSMTPTGGSSDIYINGVYKDTISHRAAETRKQVIRTWELGYGTYTFEVRVKGGGTSDVDGLAVNIVPVGSGSYDNTHPQVRYIGYWQHVDSTSRYDVSDAYNDTLSWALDAGPVMRFTFVGDQLTYVYSKAYNRGKAAITIDGVDKGYIDLYSSGVVRQQSTTFSNLGKGVHVIHITVSGQKNAASSDDAVDVDRLIVR